MNKILVNFIIITIINLLFLENKNKLFFFDLTFFWGWFPFKDILIQNLMISRFGLQTTFDFSSPFIPINRRKVKCRCYMN
jgi:hypothetical protein